jgi:hypothetical protein
VFQKYAENMIKERASLLLACLLFMKMIFGVCLVIRLPEPVHNSTISDISKTFYVLDMGFDT